MQAYNDGSLSSRSDLRSFTDRRFMPDPGAKRHIARKLRKRARREGRNETHRVIMSEQEARDTELKALRDIASELYGECGYLLFKMCCDLSDREDAMIDAWVEPSEDCDELDSNPPMFV